MVSIGLVFLSDISFSVASLPALFRCFSFKFLQSKLEVKKSAKQKQDLIVAGKSCFADLYWRNIQLQIHLDCVNNNSTNAD